MDVDKDLTPMNDKWKFEIEIGIDGVMVGIKLDMLFMYVCGGKRIRFNAFIAASI